MTEPPNTWDGDRRAWGLSADEYDHYLRMLWAYHQQQLDQARAAGERASGRSRLLGLAFVASLVITALIVLTEWLW